MTLPNGVSAYREDLWTIEEMVELGGIVGTRLTHLYAVPWGTTLASLSWTAGASMPDRPSSGEGSGALILETTRLGQAGIATSVIRVVGFETKASSL
jgi:hypothetical protein